MLAALKEIFYDIDKRIEATAPSDGAAPPKNHIVLRGVRATMSDRAANQKLLNQQIEDLISEVIPQMEQSGDHLEPEDTRVLIRPCNFFCCILHLVHFADVMSTASNEAEVAEYNGSPPKHPASFKRGAKESSGVALLRRACKAFAAGADEKSGCHGKAMLFLRPTLREFGVNTMPITPFRGHRFNILAFNSEFVFCLRNKLIEFLTHNHSNGLTASLLFDLRIPFFQALVRAFAIMSKLFTSPLWRMTEDTNVDMVMMGRAFAEMVSALEEACQHPEKLLEGGTFQLFVKDGTV